METIFAQCLSVPAAAKTAGVSAWLVWKHIRIGKLRARKLGRRTVIASDDFRAWLDQAASDGPSHPAPDAYEGAAPRRRVSRFAKAHA